MTKNINFYFRAGLESLWTTDAKKIIFDAPYEVQNQPIRVISYLSLRSSQGWC
jgi:hypothetical protein